MRPRSSGNRVTTEGGGLRQCAAASSSKAMSARSGSRFAIPPEYPTPNFAPSWNVAPTDQLPIVRYDPKTQGTHARSDALGPGALLGQGHQGRILDHQRDGRDDRYQAGVPRGVPAPPLPRAGRGFYEWKKLDAKTRQPYAFALAEGGFMALAGLWETWKSPAGEMVRSFTIVTTDAERACRRDP